MKYEQGKGSELREGTTKDLNYLSNLSDFSPVELKAFLINYCYDIRELRS